ncbi:MAG: peptidylprolyl isomerase [Terracidiphilus sp.]
MMTFRIFRTPAAFVFGTVLLSISGTAQTRTAAPQSPYGGTTVEAIIARVNDQIITSADYDRAEKELDQEERQRGATMQEASDARRDLLRNLIDQQLWLSKGKELGITGETELINRLNEIRKQYNLSSLEDLEKAAKEQGVSYEDFKQNIRNGIITQDVMRQEVGNKIQITPGEVERYYDAHKQDYAAPESVSLSEILISTGDQDPVDPAKLAAAQAKANDVETKLHAGGDFSQLARAFSDGSTASSGGELGQFKRGALAKVLEDKVFPLQVGQYTEPIRTRQGFVILKVTAHNAGGPQPYKTVQQDAEQAYFMSKMEPAIRDYLTKMRDESYIEIKPGNVDTGASPNERVFPISYSAYTPPVTKKKKKVERTRFRETGRGAESAPMEPAVATTSATADSKSGKKHEEASMKPGKKEKIRYGKAPQETLPNAAAGATEDAGAATQTAETEEPVNPLEAAPVKKKTRYSDRAKEENKDQKIAKSGKAPKESKSPTRESMMPAAPTPSEVADRQTQSSPLGLGGNQVAGKKKKEATTTGEKTRYSDRNKKPGEQPGEQQQAQPEGAQQAAPSAAAPAEAPAKQ